ncbi:MAG: type II toxin-antitoxin system ParD family antitoxin [Planctomycetota bacterium]
MKRETDLTTMNVSLSQSQRRFVEAAAARTGCTTTSEYIRRLIHEAQRKEAQEDLERKLLAGLDSGAPIEVTPEYWDKMRSELLKRLGRKKS